MLRKLLDVKRRGLAVDTDAFRRELDVEILQPAAGASADAGFEFCAKPREIQPSVRMPAT